jgi:hypothetical protein
MQIIDTNKIKRVYLFQGFSRFSPKNRLPVLEPNCSPVKSEPREAVLKGLQLSAAQRESFGRGIWGFKPKYKIYYNL